MKIEEVIFSNLVYNEDYTRKVIPYLKSEYFSDPIDNKVFNLIDEYFIKYNKPPTKDSLLIDLSNTGGLSDEQFVDAEKYVNTFNNKGKEEIEWLLDQTETFCKDKALYNAIMKSIQILDDSEKELSKSAIPDIVSEALGVSFDSSIGHDYFKDWEERYDAYHSDDIKVPFDLDLFNKITAGGLSKKTLNIALAGSGAGKSLFMCHAATANLSMGYNVLYITLEMSETMITERIESNLFDIPIKQLPKLSKEDYNKRVNRVRNKTQGNLIVKEYPTGGASAANFRHVINELKTKLKFIPDIIYIDYLNIVASARVKNNQANSYTITKSVAEEIRGLAIEFDVPIMTATQLNRDGLSSSDVDMGNISDSIGTAFTADMIFALIVTEEFNELNQILVKQIKNRYNDLNYYKKFLLGIDRTKMRLYDVESEEELVDSGQVEEKEDRSNKFKGFK